MKLLFLMMVVLTTTFTPSFAAKHECGGEVRLRDGRAKEITGKSGWSISYAKDDFIKKCAKYLKKKKNILFAPSSFSNSYMPDGHKNYCRGLANSYCRE